MAFREISPKLQLSFCEFAETWRTLILEYYSRALDPELTDRALGLDAEGLLRYSTELAAVLLSLALRAWDAKKRIAEQIRRQTAAAITDSFLKEAFGPQYEENRDEYAAFFRRKYELFVHICPNIASPDEKKRQNELIGLARYLAAQASGRPEEQNAAAIEALGVILLSAAAVFIRMAENSSPDLGIAGKPKFMVQK